MQVDDTSPDGWKLVRRNDQGNLLILRSNTGKFGVYLYEHPPKDWDEIDEKILLCTTGLKDKEGADKRFDAGTILLT